MAFEQHDTVILACCSCFLLAHILLFVCADLLSWLKPIWSVISAWRIWLAEQFRGKAAGAQDDDLPQQQQQHQQQHDDWIDKAVAQEVAKQLEAKKEAFAIQAGYCVFLNVLGMCFYTLTATRRWMNSGQDLVLIAALALTLVTRLSSRRRCRVPLWLWYSPYMLLVVLFILAAASTPSAIALTSVALMIPRFFVAWAYQKVVPVFLSNVACLGAWVYSSNSAGMLANEDVAFINRKLVGMETLLVLFVTLFASSAFNSTLAQARHVVLATTMRGEISTMTKMLNLVCDVSVELDAELQVVDSAPRLAAMLTLNPDSGARGMKLQNFMPSDTDRQLFEERLCASTDDLDGSLPGALHATLRDGLNNMINVEIFYVHFQGFDGSSRYRVGLREFADQPVAELVHFPRKASSKPRCSCSVNRSPSGRVDSDDDPAPIVWPNAPTQWPSDGSSATPSSEAVTPSSQVVGKPYADPQSTQPEQTQQEPASPPHLSLVMPTSENTAGFAV